MATLYLVEKKEYSHIQPKAFFITYMDSFTFLIFPITTESEPLYTFLTINNNVITYESHKKQKFLWLLPTTLLISSPDLT